MAVPQEKSIIEAIETLTSNSQQSELYVGQHFISWPSAIAYVSEWCNLQGFQSRLDRSDRNNNMPAGEYRKLAIVCQHSGKYKKPLAELSLNNNIKENHKTIAKVSKTIRLGCKAHINLSRPEKNNVNQYVFVTTIVNEHCHELNSQLINYTKETALTREMIEDIKFLTLQVRLTITQQRVYLEKKYDMALSLFVTIDNHNNSRLVCQALIDDETAEAHAWIFECTLLATGGKKQSNETISGGLVPLVFMTDADLAVDAAFDLQTASFLFPAIEALIKKYLTTPLYNLQVQEINQSVYYKCEQFELNQIDMFEQISEVIDTGFLEDLPDERKACIKSIFYHVNQREIKEIWGISVQNTQKFKHFILLMNNSAHLCSCLATVTREIVCRHYFSLMMHTHTAMFHIQLIRPRWYKNRDLDGKHEPFVFAAKFQDTELLKQPEINQEIFYLTALIQNNVDKWEQISKSTLDEKLFFGKVMGMAKKVTLKAVEKKDERIFEIFQRYLDELNDFEDELNSEIDTDDEANENSLQLQNPIKKPRKG
ncbi:unnamed protein product [Rhizophagus irregularis]|nr:unnamed protein product [Rhizophagus irregularis]